MFLIFSTDSIDRGGKERVMAILASRMLQKGNRVVFLAKRTGSTNNYLREYEINVNAIEGYQNFFQYRALIHKHRPGIVVSWDGISSFYNLLLHRFYSYKFVNGSIRHGIRLFRFSQLFRSIVCRFSPYIISNSKAGLSANNLKPGERRFVFYNGVEPKFINCLSEPQVEILRTKMIPDYKENPGFIFISVANFVPYKDYTTVIKALARLKEDFLFYYFILGDGPMRDEIEKSIKTYGLEKRIILVGRTENVRDYLFASDLMIHSSRGEGISNAILEAMYAGLPVIATNVGGVPETVYPDSSMLFPYKDQEALYQCLLKSRELKSSFDPNAEDYKKHLAKFSVEAMVKRFEDIIDIVTREKN